MDDDALEERRELEAVAFGRSSTRDERDAALERLHEFDRRRAAAAAAVAVATLPPLAAVDGSAADDDDRAATPRWRRWMVIGLIAAAIIAVVIAVIPRPTPSLDVFDRPQTAADRRAAVQLAGASPQTIASVRTLAAGDSWSSFGYRDPLKRVCLGLITGGALSLRCTSRAAFQRDGIGITADFVDTSAVERHGVFHWGPIGTVHADLGTTPAGESPAPYPI